MIITVCNLTLKCVLYWTNLLFASLEDNDSDSQRLKTL
jgi:hypothetical protein